MDDATKRQVSVIVRPKSDVKPADPTATDAMIQALATNPWATALMMQYTSPIVQGHNPASNAAPTPQQQPSLSRQQPQTFGALLKAVMRNRNAPATNTDQSINQSNAALDQPQTPSAVPNRMSYPREFKLLVIGYYFKNGQNKYRTCKEFQITKSMLNGWLQKVDKIQQSRPGSLKSGRSGRKPQFPQVESELYNVYLTCLGQGKKVGNRWLRETAKCIAQRRCSNDELNGMCQFSERWLCNFKKRFGINLTKDWSDKPTQLDESVASANSKTESSDDDITENKQDSTPIAQESAQLSPDTTMDGERAVIKSIPLSEVCLSAPEKTNRPSTVYEPGKRGRKVQFPQVEQALFTELREKQMDGTRVSNRWLQAEARRLAVELCPQLFTDTFKSARCMFSEHWLHNFKKRYGITLKQTANRSVLRSNTPDSPLNLTITAEPVTSSDDVRNFKIDECQSIPEERTKRSISGDNTNLIDDLPTMVPLSLMYNPTVAPPINFAEWYSKVTEIVGDRLEA